MATQTKAPVKAIKAPVKAPVKAIKKVTSVDKVLLKKLRQEYLKAFDSVHKENGIIAAVDIKKISFGTLNFKFKVEVTISDDGDQNQTKSNEQIIWDTYCEKYGFKKSDYNCSFTTSQGTPAVVRSIKTENKKYPIIAEIVDSLGQNTGRFLKLAVSQLKSYLPQYKTSSSCSSQGDSKRHYCTVCGHEIKGWFPGCNVHATCVE
jgi:hypothetical protein